MAIVNLRVYIRSVCNRLCKHFKNFIDEMSVDGVCQNNLGLFEIRKRNNDRDIPTAIAFLEDIDCLVQNVRNSAQNNSLKARQFVNESCNLQDQALSMMAQVNRDLVKMCDKLKKQSANKKKVRFETDDNVNHNNKDDEEEKKEVVDEEESPRRCSLRIRNQRSDKEENDEEDAEMASEESENMEIEINEGKMDGMIDKLVNVTKDYNIEEMEERMYSLLRIIYRHSNEWNKNIMLDEVEQHILHFFKTKR